VRQIMSAPVRTVCADTSVAAAQETILSGGHSAYPVVDEHGAILGMVSRGDLLELDEGGQDRIVDHASRDVVAIQPSALARDALHLMLEEEVDHLPVTDHGRLVGIVTRTDILGVRRRGLDHDRPQAGSASRLVSHMRRRSG